MAVRKREYRDIDLNFKPHPISGDITILNGVDAVKRSVRNLVLHSIYERPYKSDVGSRVKKSLFENYGPIEIYQLRQSIVTAIKRHEKRVKLTKINISENLNQNELNSANSRNNSSIISNIDRNFLDIEITFTVENSLEPVTVNLFLKRVR
jgi:phage baseplate assembly protein W